MLLKALFGRTRPTACDPTISESGPRLADVDVRALLLLVLLVLLLLPVLLVLLVLVVLLPLLSLLPLLPLLLLRPRLR